MASVSAQSASAHLSKMVAAGLPKARSSGRHRYYSLAGPDVAHAMEVLGAVATVPRPSTAPRSQNELESRKAQSCNDHLAGRIAVEMVKALETSKAIRISGDRDYELGRNGRSWFSNLGIDTDALQRSRRCFARQCSDWTERRPHLAGALCAEPVRVNASARLVRKAAQQARAARHTQGHPRITHAIRNQYLGCPSSGNDRNDGLIRG
jgi:hypothetical protein